MRKFSILILLMIFATCFSGENIQMYWTPNLDSDGVRYYRLYWWEGGDTTNFNLTQDSVDVDHIYPRLPEQVSPYKYIQDPWVRAAAIAVDSAGNKSEIAYSPFYQLKEFDTTPPSKMAGLGIRN